MWARDVFWSKKYHWYEAVGYPRLQPLCQNPNVPTMNTWLYAETFRKQPRHADRCKRCVAALERRKDAGTEK